MTEQNTSTTPGPIPFPEHMKRPAPQKKRWFKNPLLLIPVGALILGFSAGASTTPEPVTVVETKEVPGPERTVTTEVEVPVTPPECIEALDLAADMIGNLAEVGTLASDGVMAAYNRNGPELEAVTSKVTALNQKITDGTPAVGAATQACRASAE